jgi:cytochrome P450
MSSAGLVRFQPYDPSFVDDPYPVYAQLRERAPILHSPELGLTLIARYDDIRSLLLDGRLGRTTDHLQTGEQLAHRRAAERWDRLPQYSRYVRVNLLEMEGADHARLRRLVAASLSPRLIGRLRERIKALVEELIDRLVRDHRMEFLEDLAVPLPVHVISELLGWPGDLRHRLRPWSARIVRLYEKDYTAQDEADAEAATREFAAALDELAEARRAEPRDDLISAMVSICDQGEQITRDELISTCMLLLNAGHEATVNAAGNGLLALLRHPHQLGRLQADPALLPAAIEEMLRFDSPLQLFHRYVLEDLECGGVEFRRGDKLGLLYGSGNRDPLAFERADEFDVGRGLSRHLAFGAGAHFCLGAPLARLELEILFGTLLGRLPGIRLDDDPPRYRTGLVFRGLKALRIRW